MTTRGWNIPLLALAANDQNTGRKQPNNPSNQPALEAANSFPSPWKWIKSQNRVLAVEDVVLSLGNKFKAVSTQLFFNKKTNFAYSNCLAICCFVEVNRCYTSVEWGRRGFIHSTNLSIKIIAEINYLHWAGSDRPEGPAGDEQTWLWIGVLSMGRGTLVATWATL